MSPNSHQSNYFFLPTPFPSSRRPRPSIATNSFNPNLCNISNPPTSSSSSFSPPTANQNHPRARQYSNQIATHSRNANLPALAAAVREAEADGFRLNVVNYTAIAHAQLVAGHPQQTFHVLDDMRHKGVLPNNVTLRVAARAAAAWRKQPNIARISLLHTLRWTAVAAVETESPDAKTWNLVMRNLVRLRQYDAVPLVFNWMLTGKVFLNDGHKDNQLESQNIPKPNSWSCNTCILAYCKMGMVKEAYKLFAKMIVARNSMPKPDLVTYHTLLELALGKGGTTVEENEKGSHATNSMKFVDNILNSMQRQHMTPSFFTETLILRVLCRKDVPPVDTAYLWQRFHVAQQNKNTQNQPDKPYYDALLHAFARSGDYTGMSHALNLMQQQKLRLDKLTLRGVITGLGQHGNTEFAQKVMDIAWEQGERCDAHAYTALITGNGTYSSSEKIEELVTKAAERGIDWTVAMLNAAISAHGDELNAAITFWQKLQKMPSKNDEKKKDLLQSRVVYDAIFRVCGRAVRPDFALRVFYAARNAGHVEGNSGDSRILSHAFWKGLNEVGKVEGLTANPIKRQYFSQLQAECGDSDDIQLPIERIRIRF